MLATVIKELWQRFCDFQCAAVLDWRGRERGKIGIKRHASAILHMYEFKPVVMISSIERGLY